MLKSKSKDNTLPVFDVDFDFNIQTAFIRLGRARPVRGGVPSIINGIGPGALHIIIFII
jgi:hypothetical protein